MNIKYIIYLFPSLFLSFLFSSCNDSSSTTDYTSSSKDAQIYSFSMVAPVRQVSDSLEQIEQNSIFAIVNKTKFSIDQVSGSIYNQDSMPYGTILEKVALSLTFNSTYGVSKVTIFSPDSINGYDWNLSDSVFVGKAPMSFKVASYGGTSKTYNFDIRIHKVDPDTILWDKMSSYPASIGESKTLLAKDEQDVPSFFTYTIVNGAAKLYSTAVNSIVWKEQTLTGMPGTFNPKSISVLNDVFYGIDKSGTAYKSTTGTTWSKLTSNKVVESILGVLPAENRTDDQLLVTFEEDGSYYFGKTKDMQTITQVEYLSVSPADNTVPANFPLKGASDYTNFSTTKNSRMLIISGGVSQSSVNLPTTWLVKNTDQGLELSPYSKNSLFSGTGVSLFAYDSKMYVLQLNQFYISTAWGEKWEEAPSKQMLSSQITKRKDQSVIVDDQNYIWIFGGVSESGTYLNDVWRGRLNSLIP
ncbi:DUF6242 domain-containing protein [Dysgonomonas macrotermitis]|uniref:Galactose oxidase, central domain n=1 Tax=Dysgonomonas macrotermitis TaxID=1346286 RepID=A0A1M5CDH4_9BACT|nr:DUF6242 domain-containing protein [Dysgonomonas macrotermitis]SHF52751.1 Galactose oxidase, central domain [Dysgonomonas macrotermitis]